jgi:autotransporter-associated beta strand protein
MKMHRKHMVSLAAASLLSAAVAKAAPLVNIQVLGSLTGNAGSYSSSPLTVTNGETVYFEVEEQLAGNGTTNTVGSTTLLLGNQVAPTDGLNSLSFNLGGNSSGITINQASLALVNGWGNNTLLSSTGNATTGSLVGAVAAQNAGVEVGAVSESVMLTGNFTVGAFTSNTLVGSLYTGAGSTLGGRVFASTNNGSSYSTKSFSGTQTTDPYSSFGIGLTLNEAAPSLTWDGATSNAWDINTTANFSGSKYTDGSAVTFGDFAANGTTAVQNANPIAIAAGGVKPASVTFTNTAANAGTSTYRFTDSDSTNGIGGSGNVAITGGGTVIFSSPNSYSGGTNIASGTLKAAPASLLPTGAVTIGSSGKLYIGDGSSSVPAALATGPEVWTGNGTLFAKVDGNGSADQLTIGSGTGTLALSAAGQSSPFTISLQPGDVALGSTAKVFTVATFGALTQNVNGYGGPTPTAQGVNPGSQFVLDTSSLTNESVNPSEFSLSLVSLGGGSDALEIDYAGYSAAPEPTTAVLGLSAVAPMLLARRRRAGKIASEPV